VGPVLATDKPIHIPTSQREALLERFADRIQVNPDINRRQVSFQANRKLPFYGWFKYKEGFSVDLVQYTIDRFMPRSGVVLDPFSGAGTALLGARSAGHDAIGIELLPIGITVVEARIAAEKVELASLQRWVDRAGDIDWETAGNDEYRFPHLKITRGAFSARTERAIRGYRWFCTTIDDPYVKILFKLAGLAVLEDVSFTRKDGQYLRWDSRAPQRQIQSGFNKGDIPSFAEAIRAKLNQLVIDATHGVSGSLFAENKTRAKGQIDQRQGSCLNLLPMIDDDSVDLTVTSPPYCNRYDYTRTYALELAYLGFDNAAVKDLRQAMLSCTVENRDKRTQLRFAYVKLGRIARHDQAVNTFESCAALREVLDGLDALAERSALNNSNVPRMVRNYFFESSFVITELGRIMRSGGRVVMVNDNVRYAGEEVPVDLILGDFAESAGFDLEHIWTLGRGKGNSSQQMGAHGRSELRKCVYVWKKK